jgi:hypothetical protein
VKNITEAMSRNEEEGGVEEAALEQQQHDCIDVDILPYPTTALAYYLKNALDILTLVERRQRQQQTL